MRTVLYSVIWMNECILEVINLSSVVNIAFTLTPMSAPGSAARLALFRLTGTHCCCSTWGGSVFILDIRQECVPMQRCTLRLLVLWHNSIGSLFLSTYTTLYILLIGFLPVPCVHCWGFRDCGTPQRSTPRKVSSTSTNNH